MNGAATFGEEHRPGPEAARDVRSDAPHLSDAGALAFEAWLKSDPANAQAFEAVHAIWTEFETPRRDVLQDLSARRASPARRNVLVGAGAAAAVAMAVLFTQQAPPVPTEVYATGRGEHRTVRLADGSSVELNAGTRLSVTLARTSRRVTLEQGQAAFTVAHDARRPFEVAVGDSTIRDIGTTFDVRRRDGKLSVTVAEGLVDVTPSEGAAGKTYRLHPGQRLERAEGRPAVRLSAVEPAEALSWRSGRLIYRSAPLSEVVADLNQQFSTPIRIEDERLASAQISGVLVLDDQAAVIRRLALLVPISAVPSGEGLLLRRSGAPER